MKNLQLLPLLTILVLSSCNLMLSEGSNNLNEGSANSNVLVSYPTLRSLTRESMEFDSSFQYIVDSTVITALNEADTASEVEVETMEKVVALPKVKIGYFTDARDSNVYKTVRIHRQIWMAENLRYLPNLQGLKSSYVEPHYYVYGHEGTDVELAKSTEHYATYGVLYNWEAARTACPEGWRLPSNTEWQQLSKYAGTAVAGSKLKAAQGWLHNGNGTDNYGFNAVPSGDFGNGGFYNLHEYAYWWSATESGESTAYFYFLYFGYSELRQDNFGKNDGFAVRCLKKLGK